jgi:hypothetical protein
MHELEIITAIVSPDDAEELLPDARKHIMDVVNKAGKLKRYYNTVKSYLYEYTKRRPMVLVTLSKGKSKTITKGGAAVKRRLLFWEWKYIHWF